MDEDMNPLYILGWPLGYVMEWIYKLIPNYGWDIILFTLLITIIKIPLQLNQQKSMAKMSAFQPMVADIQKKYRDKPDKQQEELMKLQEQGYKPTAGCMPMLVNFLVMFGVIEVVYRPLQRIFHIGADAITAAGDAMTALGISFTQVTRDTNIIAQVLAGESTVTSVFTADQLNTITEFGQHMDFFGIDLTLGQQCVIVMTAVLSSIGTAGVPGSGMIMLAMVLQSVGLPVEGIALVAGVDRVLDMMRTVVNITGDQSAAVCVDSLEKRKEARQAAKAA